MDFLTEQLHDTHFWVLVSTVVFLVIGVRKGKAPILAALDARTTRIKADLNEAARLRSEAHDLLAESQRKHRDALQTAQKILDAAKDSADRLHRDTEKKLAETLVRRESQLLDRIARAESAAVQELRTEAADLAARAAERLLNDNLAKTGGKLVDDAIRDLPGRLSA
jgi:F-type H+-transporting ATPase subunit b